MQDAPKYEMGVRVWMVRVLFLFCIRAWLSKVTYHLGLGFYSIPFNSIDLESPVLPSQFLVVRADGAEKM